MSKYPDTYRYPFTPFPTGWYRADNSSNVVVGQSKVLQLLGEKLILKRELDGQLILSNSVRTFPTAEVNGLIFFYFDKNGSEPFFDLPTVSQFQDESWYPPFHLSWNCRVHIQEVAENALDLSHFCKVHTYKKLPYLSKFETAAHQFNVTMHSKRNVLGFVANTTMDITYHGMGVVISNVTASRGIELTVLLNTTPIDIENVEINMEVAVKKTKNPIKDAIVRRIFPKEIWNEFYRDIPVWESKLYRSKPALCSGESDIIRIRNWAKQFYLDRSAIPQKYMELASEC